MATRQPQANDKRIDQQVKSAGRERNTLGQTEAENAYWREHYQAEPYFRQGESFSDYEPAYRTGIEARKAYAGQRFEEIEDDLRNDWEARKGSNAMGWDRASQACRAAWDHAGQRPSTTSDRDRQVSQR